MSLHTSAALTGSVFEALVFADVEADSVIAQEEIFRPVLPVIPYADEDESFSIANNSIYGLAGAEFGEPEHSPEIARRMQTGQVDINAAQFNVPDPFGGYRQSGHGREFGRFGVEEFTEVKSIQR